MQIVIKCVWVFICVCLYWSYILDFVACVSPQDVCVKCSFVLWWRHVGACIVYFVCIRCWCWDGLHCEWPFHFVFMPFVSVSVSFFMSVLKNAEISDCIFCDWVLIVYPLCLSPGICSISSPNYWYNVFVQFQSSKSIYLERLSYERDIRFCHLGLDCESLRIYDFVFIVCFWLVSDRCFGFHYFGGLLCAREDRDCVQVWCI